MTTLLEQVTTILNNATTSYSYKSRYEPLRRLNYTIKELEPNKRYIKVQFTPNRPPIVRLKFKSIPSSVVVINNDY